MRILVLSPKPPWPPRDGGAVATVRCIEGLNGNGAEVSVLAMRTEKHVQAGSPETFVPDFLKRYGEIAVDTRIKPLSLLSNLFFTDEPYDLVRFRSSWFTNTLRSFIREGDYDIIQCEGLPFALYLDEIRKLTSAPVVLRAHNIEHRLRQMMAHTSSNLFIRGYLKNLSVRIRKLETEAASHFAAVIPISEPDSRWFISLSAGKPVHISETGAETAEYMEEPKGADLRVGFIGALNWEPNLTGIKWFLKEVWPCVTRQIPGATLHIAGRGATARAKRWLHGERVYFEGEVDDARRFMASMNVIIAPLFAGSGLRIKIIEAMSIGRSVVATPVAANGLQAGAGGVLLIAAEASSSSVAYSSSSKPTTPTTPTTSTSSTSSSAFCSALTGILKDPLLRSATGMAAVDFVRRNYDNLANTAELLEFYRRLIHGR